ncbi:MAG: DUF3108 domain-containing protein [Alphaproteobacteria bacterium]|nr:DUF3108 domain-containing protein [Alphaproteobacteria bacterium]
MSTAICRAAALLATLLALSGAARAGDLTALYRAEWAGLPAGHIRLTLHEGGGFYRNDIAVTSEGLPWLVIRFRGSAVAEGKLAGAVLRPARFDADYDLRKQKGKRLRMAFTAEGGSTLAERGPGDTSHQRILAEPFRRGVIDPLSAVTAIRDAVRRGDTAFTLPVYDGARRFDTIGKRLPPDPRDPGIHLALTLRAIAGFKGQTSEDGDPDDAPRPVALTLSDDARLLPLKMTAPIWFLPLEVDLERLCDSPAACAWPK